MYVAELIQRRKSLFQQLVGTRLDPNLIRARKYQAWRLKLKRYQRATSLESCSLTGVHCPQAFFAPWNSDFTFEGAYIFRSVRRIAKSDC